MKYIMQSIKTSLKSLSSKDNQREQKLLQSGTPYLLVIALLTALEASQCSSPSSLNGISEGTAL